MILRSAKKEIIYFYFFLSLLGAIPSKSQPHADLNAEQVYEQVNDAVVTIYTYGFDGKLLAQGSGVVLNDKGWIVTNFIETKTASSN